MQKTKKILIFLIVFLVLLMPTLSLAAGLVPCNNNNTPVTNSDGTVTQPIPCDFVQLVNLVNTVIKFILFGMVIPIAAIMFVYAGFELVTSGGSTEKRGLAKKVFTNTVIGLIFAVASWLIVRTILLILGYSGAWIGF
jgi:hypothetical protein